MENNKPGLHTTIHWRRLKENLNGMANMENIDLSIYDTDNIICYSTIGHELQR